MNRILRAVVLALATSFVLRAQQTPTPPVVSPPTIPFQPAGVTTLLMGADVANGVAPPAPGSRVRVPPLERVQMLAPGGWQFPIQWTKDGRPIPGATNTSLIIPLADASDSGRYSISGVPFPLVATGIALEVVPTGHVGNFSSRVDLPPGASTQIVGFVVTGTTAKNLLVRAVGPSLAAFGVTKPAAQPRLRLFDASGREFVFVHAAVVADIDAWFDSLGAFRLTRGENSFDYGPFPPGAYTVVVSDQSGQGGTVLVEAYEFTRSPGPRVTPPP